MKRRTLAAFMAAMVSATILAGCSSQSSTTTAPGTGAGTSATKAEISVPSEPQDGGVLVIAQNASPKNLDPVKYTGVYESQIILQVADTLVNYAMDLSEIVPGIAKSWTVSEDGKDYTFQLRDDVYFQKGQYQDGRQLKAEDVKYSLERSKNESAMDRLEMIESVDVVNDFEVIVHLPSPNASFLTALTDAGNVIVPKEEVEGWGADFGNHLVGSGPFSLKEFKLDQEAVLVKNDKYFQAVPHLDGVTFKVITDINQMANALRTGEIDFASTLTGEAVKVVRDDPNVKLMETPGLHVAYLYFNQVNGPTKDIKVREALIKAIDVNELVKGVYQYGEAKPASLPLPPGSWGYDATLESTIPTYDPAAAKQLLTEAGYPDGFKMNLYISNTPIREKMATIVQQYLKTNLNVDVTIQASEWGTFSDIASKGNADVYGMSWTWYPDPYFFLNKMFHSSSIGALGNGQGFNNAEVDKLLDDALLVTDQTQRADLYKKALKIIVEQRPGIYYANENVTWGVSPKVQGLVQRPDQTVKLVSSEVNVWKVK